MADYCIYGTGGHAKVIHSIVRQSHRVCFVHPDSPEEEYLGCKIVRPNQISSGMPIVIAIGDNKSRRLVSEELWIKCFDNRAFRFHYPSVVHKTSQNYGEIEEGCHMLANSFVGPGTKIGRFTIVNTAATVDHDCELESFVHIAPGVNLCGSVKVGSGTIIGVGSSVIPGITIGRDCTIGAGSVVVEDIPDGVVAYGNPCRVRKKRYNDV